MILLLVHHRVIEVLYELSQMITSWTQCLLSLRNVPWSYRSPYLHQMHFKSSRLNVLKWKTQTINDLSSSQCVCVFAVTGRGFRLKMCTTIVAPTTDATMSCLSPSASTERMTYTSSPTATPTPTPDYSITLPAWSAETFPTCRGNSWDSVW